MSGYTKLHSSIIHSSIWFEPDHVRIVWITMLAMADEDGEVGGSIMGLSVAAQETIEHTEQALDVLMSPDRKDPKHNEKPFEGRRIEETEYGWRLLNHRKYRNKMSAEERRKRDRERKSRYRAEQHDVPNCPEMSHDVPRCPEMSQKSHNRTEQNITEHNITEQSKKEKESHIGNVPSKTKGFDSNYTDDVRSLVDFMKSALLEAKPNARVNVNKTWYESFRLLIDRDHRDPDIIRRLITWATTHEFWAANIRSPMKLRRQWDTLETQQMSSARHPAKNVGQYKSAAEQTMSRNKAAIARMLMEGCDNEN